MRLAILLSLMTTTGSFAEVVVVRDPESLQQSVRVLKSGSTLKIGPGSYPGGHYVRGVEDLTVEALDPQKPPHIQGGGNAFHFSRCKDLTLRHLHISGQTDNGLNLDDGGLFNQPVTGITLEHLDISDIGPAGNHDGIKCSGLDNLVIRDCAISGWGGQGIDMVGCHESMVSRCRFSGRPGYSATAGVQTKGGCSDITIENCHFVNSGQRPLNIGGSTGLNLFRPANAKYEAKRIVARENTIEGSLCAAAFVGVDGAEFRSNTILFPEKWIFRFLQETSAVGYSTCRNVLVKDNRIIFRRDQMQTELNIGAGTEPETFRFENNQWFAVDRPRASKPHLPTNETNGTYGIDPR